MAFFDDLSKKAGQAGAKALEMTKGFSDVTLLRSTVSAEEKKIKETYCQIGELYVSLHQKDYEEPFGEMVQSVLSSDEKIKECKAKIQVIKDVHYCDRCGAEVPNSALYCGKCGAVTAKDSSDVPCSQCGAQVPQGTKFCTSCGAPMQFISRTQNAPVSGYVSCSQCGAQVPQGTKFCTSCGAIMVKSAAVDNNGQDE